MTDSQKLKKLSKILPIVKAEDIWRQLDGGLITDQNRQFLHDYFEHHKNTLNHFENEELEEKYKQSYKSLIKLNKELKNNLFSDNSGIRQRLRYDWKNSVDESKRLDWQKLAQKVSKLSYKFYVDYKKIFDKINHFYYDPKSYIGYYGNKEVKFRGRAEQAIMGLLTSDLSKKFTHEEIYKALNPKAKVYGKVNRKPIDDNIDSIRDKLKKNDIPDIFIRNVGYRIKTV